MQRVFLAIILGINMGLAATQPRIAFLVQLGLMIMLLIGGLTRWCFSLEILRQFLPSCDETKKEMKA
jgi:Na+/phosphate symporter